MDHTPQGNQMSYLQAGFPPYFTQDFFQSHWQLTQRCNFHCAYCCNEKLRAQGAHMLPEVMQRGLHLLSELARPVYRFSLSGGEVTLYPHLDAMLDAIEALFPSGTVVNMLSNGSAPSHRMRMLLTRTPKLKCRFIITIHLGQTPVPKLIEKMLDFSPEERNLWFHLKLVAPPCDARVQETRTQLDAAGVHNYSLNAVVDFESGQLADGYTEADFAGLAPPLGKKEYFHYVHSTQTGTQDVSFLEGLRQNLFHYRGMFCSAGYQSIHLDEYGHVSKGQFCGRMPYTILEKNPFADPAFITPMRCMEAHCTCTPFTSLPKWGDEAHAPMWLKAGK